MSTHNPSVPAIQEAIRRAGGTQSALARLLGKKQPHIYKWLHSRNPLRPENCRAIELATGVRRQDLRPDDWWVHWPELAAPAQTPTQEAEHA
ncbi:transcriptional regulator [Castellaniella ginsengisoli]|uniref:YdaS family helix-turn-helix protein n=1 Tax=Castellaniella ginsengisoli TaxID=546114 RepID=A0AB39CU37_9BURK